MAHELTGWRRDNGEWGIRNHVLVLPVQIGANRAAEQIAQGLEGVRSVRHQWEAGHDDPDRERILATLAGFGASPNLANTIVVGFNADDAEVADRIARAGGHVEYLSLRDNGGTAGAVHIGRPLAEAMAAKAATLSREPMPIAELTIGLECGGSDALSGLTANPALGLASDALVRAGGTSILAEIPELIGAEQLLAQRAVTPEVAKQVLEVIYRFERSLLDSGVDLGGGSLAPGNMDGGLTTIEEKSLGAAKKGGSAPVVGVVNFATRPTRHGLNIMDTPGQDIEQLTGMIAGGCQLVVFTTGRGSPTGCAIAPVIKVATNTRIFQRMPGDLDINAGAILDGGETLQSMGTMIFASIIATANGMLTSSELRGNNEFAISHIQFPVPA